jgi:hypothetical protein
MAHFWQNYICSAVIRWNFISKLFCFWLVLLGLCKYKELYLYDKPICSFLCVGRWWLKTDKLSSYIHGSVHRDSVLITSNKMQQYAGIYLLQIYSIRFGCPSHPSSGVHKTETAASGTGHSKSVTTFLQRGLIRPRWRKVVAQILWPVPEAAVTL